VESDVLRVFETLLPGLGDDEHEIAGLRDGLSGAASGYLGAGPRAGWVLWWGRRRAGVDIADAETQNATLRVRRGALTRSLSIMPIVRAQSVQLRRPLAHRFLGLASLQAHTVLGPVRMEMRGIELGAAQRLFDELVSVVLRVQGADARGIGDLSAEDRSTEEQGLGEQSRETEATEPPSADPPTVEPGAAQSSTGGSSA
jgi:putative membrane protein